MQPVDARAVRRSDERPSLPGWRRRVAAVGPSGLRDSSDALGGWGFDDVEELPLSPRLPRGGSWAPTVDASAGVRFAAALGVAGRLRPPGAGLLRRFWSSANALRRPSSTSSPTGPPWRWRTPVPSRRRRRSPVPRLGRRSGPRMSGIARRRRVPVLSPRRPRHPSIIDPSASTHCEACHISAGGVRQRPHRRARRNRRFR